MQRQHQNLANSRWQTFSLPQQLGNIGSEVGRAINWRKKGNNDQSSKACERALELIDLSLADKRWKYPALKEIARIRETFCDLFYGINFYQTTTDYFDKYFLEFGALARSK
ncbi:MAG: hypothetical protein HYZ51_00845 [Candidatus Doudnabacteria bacterium]|nr:hypothetical protein [Candidatus Doudnabacteria bacterium]